MRISKDALCLRARRQIRHCLLSLSLIVSSVATSFGQTTYYVASSGNDGNSGRSADAPFQTLGKVSGLSLQPGDVILLRRGDTFRGTLFIRQSGSPSQPIVVDAYGSGNKPVVAGSSQVSNWSNVGNNTWQANCPECDDQVTGLYRNGTALPLGRYPNLSDANKGYLTVQSHSGKTQLTSQQGLPTNFTGGEAVTRPNQWILDRATITGQNGNSLSLGNTGTYDLTDGWGFFIQNHPATLDQPGEWYYNPSNRTIRLYDTNDPNGQLITATAFEAGVNLTNSSNVTVRNIHITQATSANLLANGGSNLVISGNDVTNAGLNGIYIDGAANNVLVENNLIEDVNNTGFLIQPYQGLNFRSNTVRRIGMIPGRGRGGDGNYTAVQSQCIGNSVIENNTISEVGYNGITVVSNTIVRNNHISGFCQTKSDGGGIYSWNGNRTNPGGLRLLSNIIYNGVGASEGTPGGAYSGANGIFFDDCSQNHEIIGNTTFGSRGMGIFLRGAHSITIRDNTSFNNHEEQLKLAYNRTCDLRNHNIQNNILFSKYANQVVVAYETHANDLSQFGQFDNNYYVRPFEDQFKIRAVYNPGTGLTGADHTLAEWQSKFGKDPNSKNSPITYKTQAVTQLGTTLLNHRFDSNINGWSVWSPNGNGRTEFDNSNRIEGGSLRLAFPSPSGKSDSYMLATVSLGSVTKGKTYQLVFEGVSSGAGKRIQVFPRQQSGNYRDLASRVTFVLGTARQTYEATFTANADEGNTILVLQVPEDGNTAWLDNIRLQEATLTNLNPDDYIKLVYNPSFQNKVEALDGVYRDAKNNVYNNSVTVAPFSSVVLMKENGATAPPPAPTPAPTPTVLRDPENPANTVAGLNYQYYEGTWSALPDFNGLTPVKTGTVGNTDLSVRNRELNYSIRYQGFVNVPTDGAYTFYTTSDDGSKLFIGNTEVVNNDGLHGDQEKSGTIGLKAGRHAITIAYLQGGGGQVLSVSYEGPNIGKQALPASAYFRMSTTTSPTPTPTPTVLRDPENPANAVAGLNFQYYEGTWTMLPDFNGLAPAKTGTIGSPDLSVRNRESNYAVRFQGFVNVPTDGAYTFYTTSDDGSKLFIGSTEVVNNDGLHGDQEKSGTIGLKAGRHAITIAYLQGGGGQVLTVSYEGPNIGKQALPTASYFRVSTTTTSPTPTPTPTPTPPTTSLRDPENPANAVAGLNFQYYEGNWSVLPNYDALTPVKTGTAAIPNIDVRNRDNNYGLRFRGFVNVPADGVYTFYTTSDDGTKLFIGSTEVVSNDGVHGDLEKSGTIGLKAGRHAITIIYFQGNGGQSINVSYEGPNLGKQLIPASAYFLVPTTTTSPAPAPSPTNLRDPENPANTVAGLNFQYYEGNWSVLPNYDALTPVKTGTAAIPNIDVRNRDNNYGLRFRGFVNVPADGMYTFYTTSDDGTKLFIGSTEVVSNDGVHGDREMSGTIGLKAGRHAITIIYFQGNGGQSINVSYQGPNVGKQLIPASAYFIVPGTTPAPAPSPTNLRDPENPANTVAGLNFQYYEGNWSVLPNYDALTPVKTGTAAIPNISVRNRDNNYGLRFRGFVNVPTDGVYTFYTTSDDGTKLFIGSTEVVSNDGVHGDLEKSGTIGLKAGRHAITIIYFQGNGGQSLNVSYQGPNVGKQLIPASAYFMVPTAGARLAAGPDEYDVEKLVRVFPIPAREEVQVSYYAEADGEVSVQLVNTIAQPVIQNKYPVVRGENLIRLPVSELRRGMYVLSLVQGQRHTTRKVLLAE